MLVGALPQLAKRLRSPVWGCSSVGRAVALQAIGQEFESPQLHQRALMLDCMARFGRVAQLVRACA